MRHAPCPLPSCSCVPHEQLPAAIQTLAEPLLNPLKLAMQQFTPSLGAGGDTALAAQLPLFDRLATLFGALPNQHHPAASILMQAWQSLDVALLRAGQDAAALERLCRCGAASLLLPLHAISTTPCASVHH